MIELLFLGAIVAAVLWVRKLLRVGELLASGVREGVGSLAPEDLQPALQFRLNSVDHAWLRRHGMQWEDAA